jgi:hypothetical protein
VLRFICKTIALVLLNSFLVFSQSPVENLDPLIFESYASPFIEGTTSNLNSGWVQRAPKPKMLGFDMELSIIGMGTMFKEHHKSFNSNAEVKLTDKTIDKMLENIDPSYRQIVKDSLEGRLFSVNVWGPTVIGSTDQTVKLHYPGDTITINYNGVMKQVVLDPVQEDSRISGINYPVIPLGAIQLTLGTLAGTKLSFRLIPPINLGGQYGKVFYYGGGIQHNPLVWFKPKKPFMDMSLAFFAQKLKVGDVFSSYGIQTGIFFSKTLGSKKINITPYTGISYEYNRTKINYHYNYTDTDGSSGELDFNVDVRSNYNLRFRAGIAVQLTIISLSFDYSYSKYHSLSGGFGFIF